MAQGVRNDLRNEEEESVKVSWRISRSVHEQLKAEARKRDVSERLLAEQAVTQWLERNEGKAV